MKIEAELAALKRMTPAQLRKKYQGVFGDDIKLPLVAVVIRLEQPAALLQGAFVLFAIFRAQFAPIALAMPNDGVGHVLRVQCVARVRRDDALPELEFERSHCSLLVNVENTVNPDVDRLLRPVKHGNGGRASRSGQ